MIFEGLGALGTDVGVQGRLLVKNGHAKRHKTHPFGGQFSMFFGSFFDAVFEEAPGSKNHRKLVQKYCILDVFLVTFWEEADIKN